MYAHERHPHKKYAIYARAEALTTPTEEDNAEDEQLEPFHKSLVGSAGFSEVNNSGG
jgi:hypothetical protein